MRKEKKEEEKGVLLSLFTSSLYSIHFKVVLYLLISCRILLRKEKQEEEKKEFFHLSVPPLFNPFISRRRWRWRWRWWCFV